MPLPAIGGVVLDGIPFEIDPSPYEPLNWTKRHFVHKTIGGGQVIQDFGTYMTDNTLRLGSSGLARFMSGTVVKEIHRRWRARGVSYPFSDWLQNSFRIFMVTFVPIPLLRGGDGTGGTVDLYAYTMDLQVTEIIALLGEAYQGS